MEDFLKKITILFMIIMVFFLSDCFAETVQLNASEIDVAYKTDETMYYPNSSSDCSYSVHNCLVIYDNHGDTYMYIAEDLSEVTTHIKLFLSMIYFAKTKNKEILIATVNFGDSSFKRFHDTMHDCISRINRIKIIKSIEILEKKN